MRKILFFIFFFTAPFCLFSQLSISSIEPSSAAAGTSVTISGAGFSSIPDSNLVLFGTVRANVSTATPFLLTVIVPTGAGYHPVSVTVGGLRYQTQLPYIVSFGDGGTVINDSSFGNAIKIAGLSSDDISMADFDLDGKPDYVVGNNQHSSLSVYSNESGFSTVAFAPRLQIPLVEKPSGIQVGDIDGDGKAEILVSQFYQNKFILFKNNSTQGNISFEPGVEFETGQSPSSIAISDLDRDRRFEILVANVNEYSVTIYRNLSTRGNISLLRTPDLAIGSNPFFLKVGDIASDGFPDLVITFPHANRISVFKNYGYYNWRFNFSSGTHLDAGYYPYNLMLADLNNDNKLDIITTNNQTKKISILQNQGISEVSFSSQRIEFLVDRFPHSLEANDLDGDGKVDLIVSDQKLKVFQNTSQQGKISFRPLVNFANQPGGTLSTNDVNGDGKADILYTQWYTGEVSVLPNLMPVVVKACVGGSVLIKSDLEGSSYKWQVSTDQKNFVDLIESDSIVGVESINLQLSRLPSSIYGNYYRCLVENAYSGVFSIKFSNKWIGYVSNQWTDSGNWSCGVVPDSNTDVIIEGGLILINSNVTIRSLFVGQYATIRLASGVNLEVTH